MVLIVLIDNELHKKQDGSVTFTYTDLVKNITAEFITNGGWVCPKTAFGE